jgi:hypothetical protein
MSEETSKKESNDPKAKMLEALAKKQKGQNTVKLVRACRWFKNRSWSNWWGCSKDAQKKSWLSIITESF